MRIVFTVATAAVLLIACTPSTKPATTAPAGSVVAGSFTESELTARLRAAGLTIEDAGQVEQPFFTRRAHVFVVNGEDLQVYQFASAEAAANAAAEVAPTGGSIGTTMMTWMASPHFYRKERVIAIHIGSNDAVTRALGEAMGPQFAGQ